MTHKWTPEDDKILHTMWRDGKSATEISAMFPGLTRNAVMGRLNRTYDGPPKKTGFKSGVRRGPKASPTELLIKAPPIPAPVGDPVPFLALTDKSCKFAVAGKGGDVDPLLFCGAPSREKSSWCEYHHSIVFSRKTIEKDGENNDTCTDDRKTTPVARYTPIMVELDEMEVAFA